jgi:hypothetical protein
VTTTDMATDEKFRKGVEDLLADMLMATATLGAAVQAEAQFSDEFKDNFAQFIHYMKDAHQKISDLNG